MRILTTLLLALTLSCSGSGDGPAKDGACANNADCPDNFLCLEEVCTEIGCTESSDCALGYYCDATYTCTTGCSEDIDCIAGESCDEATNTCGEYGCRDTDLDCEYGEFCDTTSGECYPDTRDLCGGCDITVPNPTCDVGAECAAYGGDSCNTDNDCPDGQACDLFSDGKFCHMDVCLFQCNASDSEACPRGFSCTEAYVGDPTTYCVADCEYLLENGFLQ